MKTIINWRDPNKEMPELNNTIYILSNTGDIERKFYTSLFSDKWVKAVEMGLMDYWAYDSDIRNLSYEDYIKYITESVRLVERAAWENEEIEDEHRISNPSR